MGRATLPERINNVAAFYHDTSRFLTRNSADLDRVSDKCQSTGSRLGSADDYRWRDYAQSGNNRLEARFDHGVGNVADSPEHGVANSHHSGKVHPTMIIYLRRKLDTGWNNIERYTLEFHVAVQALILGLWLLTLQPMGAHNPSMRGFLLLSEIVKDIPIRPDWVWGLLIGFPSALQVWMVMRGTVKQREWAALGVAAAFFTIAILLCLDNPRSAGIPMYAYGVGVGELYSMARLYKFRQGLPT